MKIFRAKKRVMNQCILAVLIMATSAIIFMCAALKSIYFSMDGDVTALSSLSNAVQQGVYFIYQRTQFLSWFWQWAPVINPKELNTPGNLGFFFNTIAGAIGRLIFDSAANLSNRIAKTVLKVEEFGWEQELMN